MTSMRISWSDTRTRFPNIEKGEIMERAILGMEIESLSALNDWFVIANLVEVSVLSFLSLSFFESIEADEIINYLGNLETRTTTSDLDIERNRRKSRFFRSLSRRSSLFSFKTHSRWTQCEKRSSPVR